MPMPMAMAMAMAMAMGMAMTWPFYSMPPVKNTLKYLAIMYQPVEDGCYTASQS